MIEPMAESSRSLFDMMKYITTLVSMVVSSLAVFVLVRYLPYATSAYRTLLIGTTVTSLLVDFHLQILMDPVFMIPLPCMYFEGILDTVFHVHSSLGYEMWITGVGSVSTFYWFCALYRNQILLPLNHRFRLSHTKLGGFIVFMIALTIIQGPLLEFAMENSEVAIDSYVEKLSKQWPTNIRKRIGCIIPSSIPMYGVVYGSAIGTSVTFLLLVCFHTLYCLNRMQILSEKTRNCHRRLTKSLIAQIIIPGVTIFLPSTGFVVQQVIQIDKPEIVPFMLKIIGMHSIVHSLTVIFSTNFCSCFRKKTEPARKITLDSWISATQLR